MTFYNWAIKNGHKKGLQIDRKDNDGNYCPENCRFVTQTENMRNRSEVKLNTEKVKEIKRLLKEKKLVYSKIGRMFNVSGSIISAIHTNRKWKDV